MSYAVNLDVFEGPFDLLLQLIARRQLDVTEIDLAEITGDFLAFLGDLDDLDLETATRFLVVAATLIELKAARLLPAEDRQELEDLLGEARDVLYARLLEYRAYRDVARVLDHRLHQHAATLPREAPVERWLARLVPDTPLSVDATGLAVIAASALTPEPERTVDLSHIRRSYVSVRDASLALLSSLPADGARRPFAELVTGRTSGDRIVFFLAILELFKLGHLDLDQPHHRATLEVGRADGGRDLALVLEELTDDEPADVLTIDAPAVDEPAADGTGTPTDDETETPTDDGGQP